LLTTLVEDEVTAAHVISASKTHATRRGYHAIEALKVIFLPEHDRLIDALLAHIDARQMGNEGLEAYVARMLMAQLRMHDENRQVNDLDMVSYCRIGLRRSDFDYEFKQLIQLNPTSKKPNELFAVPHLNQRPSIIHLQPSWLPLLMGLPRLFSPGKTSELQMCQLLLMTLFIVRSLVRKTPFTYPFLVPRLVTGTATSLDTSLLTVAKSQRTFCSTRRSQLCSPFPIPTFAVITNPLAHVLQASPLVARSLDTTCFAEVRE
jgi:hypothetical protein